MPYTSVQENVDRWTSSPHHFNAQATLSPRSPRDPLGRDTSQNRALDPREAVEWRHAALDTLVAAVELGPRLLEEHHPQLIGILTYAGR